MLLDMLVFLQWAVAIRFLLPHAKHSARRIGPDRAKVHVVSALLWRQTPLALSLHVLKTLFEVA